MGGGVHGEDAYFLEPDFGPNWEAYECVCVCVCVCGEGGNYAAPWLMDRLRCPRGKVIVTACSWMGSLAVHTPALLASNWVNPCTERSTARETT